MPKKAFGVRASQTLSFQIFYIWLKKPKPNNNKNKKQKSFIVSLKFLMRLFPGAFIVYVFVNVRREPQCIDICKIKNIILIF